MLPGKAAAETRPERRCGRFESGWWGPSRSRPTTLGTSISFLTSPFSLSIFANDFQIDDTMFATLADPALDRLGCTYLLSIAKRSTLWPVHKRNCIRLIFGCSTILWPNGRQASCQCLQHVARLTLFRQQRKPALLEKFAEQEKRERIARKQGTHPRLLGMRSRVRPRVHRRR